MKKKINIFLILLLAVSVSGCYDFFNPKNEAAMPENEYISTNHELYTGYMGIISAVQKMAEKPIFLEGLRGDFMEPTRNAPQMFWDVYSYQSDLQNNELADPKEFYYVILNANDYIDRVFKFKKENPTAISDDIFEGLIGGAIRFKVFAYMNLAKIYGQAIYLDDPLIEYKDLNKFPMWSQDQIFRKCIDLIQNGVNGVNGKKTVRFSRILYPNQPNGKFPIWDRMTPPYQVLLGELYLWTGEYMKTITNIMDLINTASSEHPEAYILSGQHHGMTNGKWPDFQSVGPTTNISPFADGYAIREHVFLVTYDYSKNQTNNLIRYFSTIAPNKYYIKPSTWGMSLFDDMDPEGLPRRDTRANYTGNVDVTGSSDTVVIKFVRNFRSAAQSYRNDVAIIPYLAADLHLMMAEAFIGLGRFREALVLWNEGFVYHKNEPTGSLNLKVPAFSIFNGSRLPYRTPGSQAAYANLGVRGRAYGYGSFGSSLTPVIETTPETLANSELLLDEGVVRGAKVLWKPNENIVDDQYYLDSLLLRETRFESAANAKVYYTMIRMARHFKGLPHEAKWRQDCAKIVASKYKDGDAARIEALLMNPENWYIPFDLK